MDLLPHVDILPPGHIMLQKVPTKSQAQLFPGSVGAAAPKGHESPSALLQSLFPGVGGGEGQGQHGYWS